MKNISVMAALLFVIFFHAQNASAFDLTETQGSYHVKTLGMPIESNLTINEAGVVELTEQQGRFNCEGQAKIKKNILSVTLNCSMKISYKMVLDLTDVKNLDAFVVKTKVTVVGTRLGTEIPCEFTKLQD